MQQLFRFAQRFKPEASVDQYASLLNAAFDELASSPEPPELDDPFGPDIMAYLQAQSAFWERVNSRRLELESVRPDHRLQRVHEEMVKYLRGTLTILNLTAASTQAAFQGNFAEVRRKEAEAESWAPVLENVARKLRDAMRQIQDQQPTLFSMLRLSPSILAEFDIRTDDPSQLEAYVLHIIEAELSDPNEDSWHNGLQTIVQLGDQVIPVLLDLLHHQDESISGAAGVALGHLGERAISGLRRALQDENPNVRLVAVTGIGFTGPSAVHDLLPMLRDPSTDVGIAASMALGMIGSPAVPGLREMLNDTDPDARGLAAYALEQLGYE